MRERSALHLRSLTESSAVDGLVENLESEPRGDATVLWTEEFAASGEKGCW